MLTDARDVFFFQAEDGIRDIGVTGVQTCALPICWLVEAHKRAGDEAKGRTARSLDPSAPAGAANGQATTATARCAGDDGPAAARIRSRAARPREVIPRRRSAARLARLSYALSAWSLSVPRCSLDPGLPRSTG